LRYAYGIFLGALLSGIIFGGSAVIKIMDLGWETYLLWFFISLLIIVLPIVISRVSHLGYPKEIAIYIIGGFMLFGPLWFALLTEMTGDSFMDILLNGVTGAIPAPGEQPGSIVGVAIGPYLLMVILALQILLGIIVLRPSFINSVSGPEEMPELTALKEDTTPEETPPPPPLTPLETPDTSEPLEAEMPEVAPPTPDVSTVSELRELLIELNVPEPTINRIMGAGYATVTDLVATSADQLVAVTGLDKQTAEDLHMAVQKKVWFGGI
jgi:hypothetical protein